MGRASYILSSPCWICASALTLHNAVEFTVHLFNINRTGRNSDRVKLQRLKFIAWEAQKSDVARRFVSEGGTLKTATSSYRRISLITTTVNYRVLLLDGQPENSWKSILLFRKNQNCSEVSQKHFLTRLKR